MSPSRAGSGPEAWGSGSEEGWGSPLPAEYGSLRPARQPAVGSDVGDDDYPADDDGARREGEAPARVARRADAGRPAAPSELVARPERGRDAGRGWPGRGRRAAPEPPEYHGGLAGTDRLPAGDTGRDGRPAGGSGPAVGSGPGAGLGPGAAVGPGSAVGSGSGVGLGSAVGPGPAVGSGSGAGLGSAGGGFGIGAGSVVGGLGAGPWDEGPGSAGPAEVASREPDVGLGRSSPYVDVPSVHPTLTNPVFRPSTEAVGAFPPAVSESAPDAPRSVRRPPGRVRTRATVRHLDVLSVVKVSVAFYLVAALALVTASVLLWVFADAFNVLPSLDKSVRSLFSLKTFVLHPGTVALYAGGAGLVLCVAGTFANVVAALAYNLIADVVGGLRVELESAGRE